MATIECEKPTFTVNDAAERFKRSTARIRQICIANRIGRLIENRIRLLSPEDMERIGEIISRNARESQS